MKLYYHKTDGGAEYHSTTYVQCPNGEKEGTSEGVIMRTDGNNIIVYVDAIEAQGINLVMTNRWTRR